MFGWNPELANEANHKTEIDMLVGNCIFEAKLTESDFTSKSIDKVLTYQDVEQIFDLSFLVKDSLVTNYQLIRNILVANKYNYNFFLILDERRIDLIREFVYILIAIKDKVLAQRIKFVTWQEISACLGKD